MKHGTNASYVSGCVQRCADCRRAHAEYEARRLADVRAGRPRRIPAVGVHRRLQALVALGWPQYWLAQRLGLHRSWVQAKLRSEWVTPAVYERVCRLYDALWDVLPPQRSTGERNAVSRARTFARLNGWVPPLAWDDDLIDDPDARPVGVEVVVRRARGEALAEDVRWLADAGVPVAAIAERTGTSRGYVTTLLERDRSMSARPIPKTACTWCGHARHWGCPCLLTSCPCRAHIVLTHPPKENPYV